MYWNISTSDLSAYWREISIRSVARRATFHVARRLAAQAQLYAVAKHAAARVPFLDRRLRAIIRTGGLDARNRAERIVDVADLTPHAHQVYGDLLRATKVRQ